MGKCNKCGNKNKIAVTTGHGAKFSAGQTAYLSNTNGQIGQQIRYRYIPVVVSSVENKSGIFFYRIVGHDLRDFIEASLFTIQEVNARISLNPLLHTL